MKKLAAAIFILLLALLPIYLSKHPETGTTGTAPHPDNTDDSLQETVPPDREGPPSPILASHQPCSRKQSGREIPFEETAKPLDLPTVSLNDSNGFDAVTQARNICADYRAELSAIISASGWPQGESYSGIVRNMKLCQSYHNAGRALVRQQPGTGLSDALQNYKAVISQFDSEDWDSILENLHQEAPQTSPLSMTWDFGLEKNLVYLAALYGAPAHVIDQLVEGGEQVPDYTLPLALHLGNHATFTALFRHNRNINAMNNSGAPFWSSLLISGGTEALITNLAAAGANLDSVYRIGNQEGTVLDHYVAHNGDLIDDRPDMLAVVESLAKNGATISVDTLQRVGSRNATALLRFQVDPCR